MQSAGVPIRVLLADDHAVVRAGYRMLLERTAEIRVIGEASSGEQACRIYLEQKPDVVVIDLSMPGPGGLEAIRRIIARDPRARLLVFSMHDDTVFVDQAINAGARGYITKNCAPEVMVEAIRTVAAGRTFLEAALAQRLAFRKIRGRDSPFSSLSTREFEICCLLAEGCNTSEIAKRLSLSYKTVANYSSQIKAKLNVGTAAELTRLAIRHNIVQP
ncbi:MAG: response regulator transcription factor [Gammaproteobacteria bacterium]|nr:response regulator transcription factor [Gammaproteobacteria bacterium]